LNNADVLIQAENLVKNFPVQKGSFTRAETVHAVQDVSFAIPRGATVALVGESGSGKSTVGRLLLRLQVPTSGKILFDNVDLSTLSRRTLPIFRRRMQMVFQDPFASLNPHMRVSKMLDEPLRIHGIGSNATRRRERVEALLDLVGLPTAFIDRYPHEFSGGQRQRLAIARALAVEPEFIVADEAISALDVSNQAQIINLLVTLKSEQNLTLLFISHNLAVVQNIADTVVVMYLGKVMEIAPTSTLFAQPWHPYTQALLSAVPIPDPERSINRVVLSGDIPSPINPPSGCVFRTRCPHAIADCAQVRPALQELRPGRHIACIRHGDLATASDAHTSQTTTASVTATPG
jgi:oligopeptide/dipeptide ABC transporter ATP-binding protein